MRAWAVGCLHVPLIQVTFYNTIIDSRLKCFTLVVISYIENNTALFPFHAIICACK